jgi:hypothetical protein
MRASAGISAPDSFSYASILMLAEQIIDTNMMGSQMKAANLLNPSPSTLKSGVKGGVNLHHSYPRECYAERS